MRRERGSILLTLMVVFLLCGLYLSSGVVALSLKIFQLQRWHRSLEERERTISLFLQERARIDWSEGETALSSERCHLFSQRELRQREGFSVKRVGDNCYPASDRTIYQLSFAGGVSDHNRVLYQYQFVSKNKMPILEPMLNVEREEDRWILRVRYQGEVLTFQVLKNVLRDSGIDLDERDLATFGLVPMVENHNQNLDLLFALQGGKYLWKLKREGMPKLLHQFRDEEWVLASLFKPIEGNLYLLVVSDRHSLAESLTLYLLDVSTDHLAYKVLQEDLLLSYRGVAEKGNFKVERVDDRSLVMRGEMRERLGSAVDEFLFAIDWNGDALWGRDYFWRRSAIECGFQQEAYEPIPGWQIGCQRQASTKLLYLY